MLPKLGTIVRWKADGVLGKVCPINGYRDDLKSEWYTASVHQFAVHWEGHRNYENGLVAAYFSTESMIEILGPRPKKEKRIKSWRL
jgi:hypothetical protein